MKKQMEIPLIGLGTWRLKGQECESVVKQALELGYRHIDTADFYQNHAAIGRAIQGYPRNELFLATKLLPQDLSPDSVHATVSRFLNELEVDYLDLLLIHRPNPDINLKDTLEAMMSLKKRGTVRFIGVSNFVRFHLEAIESYQFPILTNQIELHPYLQRRLLVATCKRLGITVTAYRPLAKGAFESNAVLKAIGNKYQKSPSQVVLRWLIQQGIPTIPKASSLQHLKDNINIFDFVLKAEEMEEINQLDANLRFCAPEGVPIHED